MLTNTQNEWRRRSLLVGRGEWATVALVAAAYAAWIVLTLNWRWIPAPLLAMAAAYCLTLYGSLQHEVIHGHPTTNRRINLSLVWLPLTLWMPLSVYESSHLEHHRSELTRPGTDPESWYVAAARWASMGVAARALFQFNNTLVGRMLVGPWLSAWQLWTRLARDAVTNRATRRMMAGHLAGVAAVLGWVVAVTGMPAWYYLLVFAWPGTSLTLLRSFIEHRYDPDPECRTAIVRAGPLTRLAFLNNNYHWTHHRHPGLAWYRIPAAYQREADAVTRANGGFEFDGYGEIARRYLFRPWTGPAHPGS